jgi:ADP-ribose pyrophosphatase YjhB (NUDIX family)
MLLDFLFQIWRRLRGSWQWRLLWLVNSKFMVSVAGVVLDHRDRVLLQRHRHWVADVWGLPGGIVHGGETLEAAFAREVWEETGLRVEDVQLAYIVSGYNLRLEVFFRARLAGEAAIRLQSSEVLEARFFATDELPANLLPQHQQLAPVKPRGNPLDDSFQARPIG